MENKIKSYYYKIKRCAVYIGEKKNLKKKKKLIEKVSLTDEQKKAVDDIWIKNYGKKISKDYHRLYTSYTQRFDKNYFPEILFTTNLFDKMNPPDKRKHLDDKLLMTYFIKSIENEKVKLAKNYVYNCNGYYYNEGGIIDYQTAIDKIKRGGQFNNKTIY